MKKQFTPTRKFFNLFMSIITLMILFIGVNMNAQIGNMECNAIQNTPFVTSNFDNLRVRNAFFTFPNNVIDSNLNNTSGSGFFLLAGGWISVEDRNDVYPAGTFAGWRVNMSSLTIGRAGFIRISTKLNGQEQERIQVDGSDLVTLEGTKDVGFVTTQDFDEIRFDWFAAGIGFPSATVFHAVVNRYCEGPTVDCSSTELTSNVATPLQKPQSPVYVNPERSGVNALIELSRIDNLDALVSPDDNDFATLVDLVSVASVADISVKNGLDTYPAGTFAGYEIENNQLVAAQLLDAITITTFNNGVEQETKSGDFLLVGAPLFDFGNRRTIGFTTTEPFDEIRIRFIKPVSVSVFGTTKIFHAIIKQQCEGPGFECNEQTAVTSPAYPVNINMERTGTNGIACVGCRVHDAEKVVDNDPNNYAVLGEIGAALTSTSISVQKAVIPGQIEPWEAGTMAGFEIENVEFINADAFNGITLETYLNGQLQESSTDFNLAIVNSLMLNGIGRQVVGFETTLPYDEVLIRGTNLASVNLGGTKVYRLVIQSFCDFVETDCNIENPLSFPAQPVFVNADRTGVNGVACVGCEIRNTNNVIDGDANTYATFNGFSQALGAASISVKLGGDNEVPAGYYAGFDIERDNFLDAEVLNGVVINTYKDGIQQESVTGEFGLVGVNSDILANDGRYTIGIVATVPFDEVQIVLGNTAEVNFGNTKVFDAVIMNSCDGVVDCNSSYYLTRPDFPVALTAERTGQIGLACVGCAVTEPDNVLDDNPNNFATLNKTVGVAGTVGLSVVDVRGTYPRGTYTGFTIKSGFPINVDVLEFVTISTYLDGVRQETHVGFDLIDLELLIPIFGNDTKNAGFYTTKPFDEVEIRFSGVAEVLNVIEVYGLFVDTRNIIDEDGNLLCSSLTAVNDINQTQEGQAVSGNVLTNDFDPEGGTISIDSMTGLDANGNAIEISSDAANPTTLYDAAGNVAGTASYNAASGEYTFTPADGFVGEVPIQYTAIDDGGDTDSASLTIQVIPTPVNGENNPPVANDDTVTTPNDTPVTGNVLGNDSDPDGDDLTVNITPVAGPNHGSVVINPDGTFTYTPDPGYVGEDSFEYEVCDNGTPSICTTATVTVSVVPDNDVNKTYANDDANTGKLNEVLTGNVLDNDTDPEGDAQSVSQAHDKAGNSLSVDGVTENSLPNGGKIVIAPDGSYTYTPAPGYAGTEQIIYQVSDTNGATDTATLYLTSLKGNSLIANNDINQTPQGKATSGNVLTNDVDPEGTDIDVQEMTGLDANGNPVVISSDANNPTTIYDTNGNPAGAISYNPETGDYNFTPTEEFSGEVPISYTAVDEDGATDSATLTIQVVKTPLGGNNNPPVANDDTATTPNDTPVTGNVLGNDSDPDGDDLTVNTTPVAGPNHGTVDINPDGTFTYTPDPGFVGEDSFDYEVCDNGTPSICTTATVTVNVVADDGENTTYANDDANTGMLNETLAGNVLDNDTDPQGDVQSLSSAKDSNGNALVVDGSTANTLPNGGTIILNSDGSYTYTPANAYVGNEQITYVVSDGNGATDTATLYLTTLKENTLIAINDINQTPEGQAVSGNVLTNDIDPEGTDITVDEMTGLGANGSPVLISTDASNPTTIYDNNGNPAGTISYNPNTGEYNFTPADGFTGEVPISYTAVDADGAKDSATLSIQVVPDPVLGANNPPVANDDTATTPNDTPVSGNVLGNDSDPDGDDLTVNTTPVAGPDHGSVVINPDGTFTYTPDAGFIGEDSFEYEVCDNGTPSICTTATVTVNVVPDNNENTTYANDDANSGPLNEVLSGNVLDNDTDPEGDTQTVAGAKDSNGNALVVDGSTQNTLPNGGKVIIHPDGTYTYTPAIGFEGTEQIVYEVSDGNGASDSATLYLTSLPPANTTNAINDINQTLREVAVSGNVLINDTDDQGDAQHVLSVRADRDRGGVADDDLPLGVATTVYAENPISAGYYATAGEITIHEDGSYTFVPHDGYYGTVRLEYTVQDDNAKPATDTASLTINIIKGLFTNKNNPPIAQDDTQGTLENTPVDGNVLSNDADPDEGDALSVSAAQADTDGDGIADDSLSIGVATTVYGTDIHGNTSPAGTIVLNTDGSYDYTPAQGFVGDVPVHYTASDLNGAIDDAILVISVYPNNPEVPNVTYANADANSALMNVEMTGNVLLNDSDPEGDSQSLTGLVDSDGNALVIDGTTSNSLPNGGSIVMDSAGNYTYTPANNFLGTTELVYTVCDSGSPQACAQTTLQLTSIPYLIPDYQIIAYPGNTNLTQESNPADFVVRIVEVNGAASDRIPRVMFRIFKTRFMSLGFDATYSGMWGSTNIQVDNTQWEVTETPFFNTYTYIGGEFPAFGSFDVGISNTLTKPYSDFNGDFDVTTFIPQVQVGGETNYSNNRDVIVYTFR